jgi:hypothetical protein
MAYIKPGLTENIALLAQFPKYLEEPATNQPPSWPTSKAAGYTRNLTLEQEKRWAETFALLLATTNDPSRVGAVCIEEKPDGSGFVVRTATNTGSQEGRKSTFYRLINAAKLESKLGTSAHLTFSPILITQY